LHCSWYTENLSQKLLPLPCRIFACKWLQYNQPGLTPPQPASAYLLYSILWPWNYISISWRKCSWLMCTIFASHCSSHSTLECSDAKLYFVYLYTIYYFLCILY
jgi:hypothetical protein